MPPRWRPHPGQFRLIFRIPRGVCILPEHVLRPKRSIHINSIWFYIQAVNGFVKQHMTCVQTSYSKSFHILSDFFHIIICIGCCPRILAPDFNAASYTHKHCILFDTANSRSTAEGESFPVSTSQEDAPARKNLLNFLAFVLVSGRLFNFSSRAFHSSLSYTNKQPSKPFVTTNSSPSCSLNFDGTIRRPLHRLYDCIRP